MIIWCCQWRKCSISKKNYHREDFPQEKLNWKFEKCGDHLLERGSNQHIHICDISNDCVGSWCVVLLEVGEDDNIWTIWIRKNLSLKSLSVQRCKACLFGFVRKCLTYLNNILCEAYTILPHKPNERQGLLSWCTYIQKNKC